MKRINILIFTFISFILFSSNVYAANSFYITAPSSASIGKPYEVKVSYSGQTAGSFAMQFKIINAECSVKSSSGVSNCTGGVCLSTYENYAGIENGTLLMTLTCTSYSTSTAKFTASQNGDDAWDLEGANNIKISSSGTKLVTITGTTSKSTISTTKSTAPYRTTSSSSTKKVTTSSKTTSKSTSKKATSSSTSNKSGGDSTSSTSTTLRIEITDQPTETISTNSSSEITNESTVTDRVEVSDSIRLKDLKIVGYDIGFSPNKINYTIEVAEDVKEIYVIADKSDENINVDNAGVVNIDDQKEILIRVSNSTTNDSIEYKIKVMLKKQSGISLKIFLATIGGMVLLVIIVIVLKEIRKVKKATNSVEPLNVINDDLPINSPIEPIQQNEIVIKPLEDTMEIFDSPVSPVQPPVAPIQPAVTPIMPNTVSQASYLNQVSDIEKQRIDDASEAWLEKETISTNDDITPIMPNVIATPESDINQLFSTVDNYSDKQ